MVLLLVIIAADNAPLLLTQPQPSNLTNNQAERSLRSVVIMRKVVHCTRSAKGLENHSVLRSLFETARRQGKQPHSFFLELFTRDTAQAQAALYRKPLDKKIRPPLRC